MVSFLKKTRWIVSKIGMRSWFDTASMLLLVTFSSYLFEDHFFYFSTFSKSWKKCFFAFSQIGYFFTALVMKSILNRFMECGLVSLFNWNNFFWLFGKNWFFPFLTQHFHLKNKKFWKWLKMVFDGWFDLPIVNLVGIEYLKVKIR